MSLRVGAVLEKPIEKIPASTEILIHAAREVYVSTCRKAIPGYRPLVGLFHEIS